MSTSTLLVDYLGQGVAASRPVAPATTTGTLTFYYSTDTTTLSFYDWNAAAWVDVTASVGSFAVLGTSNVFTAAQGGPIGALTDAANIAWNAGTTQIATVTLAGNRTLSNQTGGIAGFTYILIVTQDGSGSRTLAYDTNYKFPGGTAPTLSTGAGDVDVLTFVSPDGTLMYGTAQLNFS